MRARYCNPNRHHDGDLRGAAARFEGDEVNSLLAAVASLCLACDLPRRPATAVCGPHEGVWGQRVDPAQVVEGVVQGKCTSGNRYVSSAAHTLKRHRFAEVDALAYFGSCPLVRKEWQLVQRLLC